VLFCIYLYGFLLALRDSKVGCYIGQAWFLTSLGFNVLRTDTKS